MIIFVFFYSYLFEKTKLVSVKKHLGLSLFNFVIFYRFNIKKIEVDLSETVHLNCNVVIKSNVVGYIAYFFCLKIKKQLFKFIIFTKLTNLCFVT